MRLTYSIDENDVESQRALQQAESSAPKANVIAAMQTTLAKVLQSQTPPPADQASAGQTAAGANASWGKAQ